MPEDSPHRAYHQFQYGFPLEDDSELFGRLILEINQAGLSWTTILKKTDNFRIAYAGFDIARIAAFGEKEVEVLMSDAGIIRNRLKIEAVIFNARRILEIKNENDSFLNWLKSHHPRSREDWTKLFRKNFRFTGGEIVNEFLMCTGFLPGAHSADCPVFEATRKAGALHFESRNQAG